MSEQSGNGPANPVSLWRRGLKPAGTAFGIGSFVGNRRSESSSIQGTKLQSEATTTKRRTELEVLREAAEKGNASDQYHFGRCYENSLSLRLNPNGPVTLVVPQDYAEAIKWYRKAAEQDFFMAQAELGRMLYAGLGSPQNY